MNRTLFQRYRFSAWLILISVTGGIIRAWNINYASLWGDELYSMFSVHPSNSWYEVLYWQRTYQPPLYFMVLWVWVKVFAYTEFYARLLSVLTGTLGILVSGYLGKKMKNEWAGIAMALLVCFSPVQIWYSLEARFYVFVYLFAALSLWLYWHIIQTKTKQPVYYFIKAVVDASLCYFHHFGIVFLFGQFCFDVLLFTRERDKGLFIRQLGGYFLAGLFYSPWIFWGLPQGYSLKKYWVTETNITRYFLFSIDYTPILQVIVAGLILVFLYYYSRRKRLFSYLVLPVICVMVIVIPYLYSILKLPILLERYSMVMAPAIYLMMVLGLYEIYQRIRQQVTRAFLLPVVMGLAFSWSGIYMSFINKDRLKKHPWRQMAGWLKQQPDFNPAIVYGPHASFKNFRLLDFYLKGAQPSHTIEELRVGQDKKMYLVEGTSVWKIPDSILNRVTASYKVTRIGFQDEHPDHGAVYVCELKTAQP